MFNSKCYIKNNEQISNFEEDFSIGFIIKYGNAG